MHLPAGLIATVHRLHGDHGRTWIADLPGLVAACAEQWQIVLDASFESASHSFVAPGIRSDGRAVVLKVVPPTDDGYTWEEAALRCYAGRGAARLLASAVDHRALLLERAVPGEPMSCRVHERREDDTLLAAARVMGRLWRAGDDGVLPDVPRIEADLDVLARNGGRHGEAAGMPAPSLRERAEAAARELVRSAPPPVLIHGDLHHDNLLSSGDAEWLAIDPKGRLGERAYEVAALVRNPLADLLRTADLRARLTRRVDVLSEALQLERERILGWSFVMAVVAACWALEDRDDTWTGWHEVAATLAAIHGTP